MSKLLTVDVADLSILADLFEYPRAGFADAAARAANEAGEPEVRKHLATFAADVANLQPEFLEEAHVRTFLIAPASAPYVGVHLFGEESFKRAHLMALLVERFAALGFDAGNELPDHVGVLLRFAHHLDAEERSDLVLWCLSSPVTAMHASLANSGNPYRHLLAALKVAVAPEGVPTSVAAAIAETAKIPDQEGCFGCSVKHGGDEA